MTQQEISEAIEAFKDRKAELVEWDFSQSCINYYDTAIKALETVQKIPEVVEELEKMYNEVPMSYEHDYDSGQNNAFSNCIDLIKGKLGV